MATRKLDAAALAELEARATTRPNEAIATVSRLLTDGCSPRARVKLLWIRGLAHRKARQIALAIADLEAAADLARAVADRRLLAQVLVALAGTHGYDDPAAALATLAKAPTDVGAKLAAAVEVQRAFLLQRATRPVESEAAFSAALALMRRAPAKLRAALMTNRGIQRTYQGHFAEGAGDFAAALRTYERLGLTVQVAELVHNIAWLDGRRGELAASLRGFEDAAARYPPDIPLEQRYPDECETYLALGLTAEAHARALLSARWLEAHGDNADAAEVYLLAARAGLAGGDFQAALEDASNAERLLPAAERPGWRAEAALLAMDARIRRDGSSAGMIGELVVMADQLDIAGLPSVATDALVLTARAALDSGDVELTECTLRRCARRHPTLQQRVALLTVRAQWAAERGATRPARQAITAGAALLDGVRRGVGAPELRAHLALHGVELAELDVAMALDSGSVGAVLRSSERWRAGALQHPRMRPPVDETLSSLLDELRGVEELARRRVMAGDPDAELERRLRSLQRDVLRRSRTAGAAGDRRIDSVSLRGAAPVLAGHELLVVVEHRGQLYGMAPLRRRAGVHSLGSAAETQSEVLYLRAAVDRLMVAPAERADRYEAQIAAAAGRLEELLLEQLEPGESPAVLVVPASLAGVPWACLPGLRDRPFTITPSLAVWTHLAALDAPTDAGTLLAAGPDLEHAEPEVHALQRLHDDAVTLDCAAATPAAVLPALDGVGLAHLACHGVINSANPLLSRLLFTGGPLYVYDLEQLAAPPRTTVLSACHVGAAAARPGDELLGFTSSLLALGGRSVIAAVQAVPDSAATSEMMVRLHRRLLAGDTPAAALAAVRIGVGAPPASLAFACFGVG